MLSVLLRDLRMQSEQIGRLHGALQASEGRLQASIIRDQKATQERLRSLQREVGALKAKVHTPLWKQLWGEWYVRLMLLIGLGLANIDLKEAIALVLQIK